MNHSRSILVLLEHRVFEASLTPMYDIAIHDVIHGSACLRQLDLRRTIQEIQQGKYVFIYISLVDIGRYQ